MSNPQEKAREAIQHALRGEDLSSEGLQPAIIYNYNIDHTKVEKYASCYLNESWQEKINQFLAEGYVPFRIQTEFFSDRHLTMIYMAKMKTN